MEHRSKKILRYTISIVLIIIVIGIGVSYFLSYHVKPQEIYLVDSENLIEDGGFENFSVSVWDCCPTNSGNASIFASQSNDSFKGKYSLNLTSFNHCSCINKPILNLSNLDIYILSFYYKGNNSRFCNWVSGDNACSPGLKLNSYDNWNKYNTILQFTNLSINSLIHFYADSSGQPVTNLYDDLQVHRLIPISYEDLLDEESFNQDAIEEGATELVDTNQYVILTKKDNIVHNGEYLSDSQSEKGFGYYLVNGKPDITLRFPLTELIIAIILIAVVIRLIFKRSEDEIHEEHARKIRKDIEKRINYSRKEEI